MQGLFFPGKHQTHSTYVVRTEDGPELLDHLAVSLGLLSAAGGRNGSVIRVTVGIRWWAMTCESNTLQADPRSPQPHPG